MDSSTVGVKFSVNGTTKPGEIFFVVGDCPELGAWLPEGAQALTLERHGEDGEEIWSKTIQIDKSCSEIKYRYFIAHRHEADYEEESAAVMVLWWETNRFPRLLQLSQAQNQHIETEVETFGIFNGLKSIDKGWLTKQTAIHIRVHSNPIKMLKLRNGQQGTYYIKCSPLNLQQRDSPLIASTSEDSVTNDQFFFSTDCADKVGVSILNGEDDNPSEQAQFGTLYQENDYMVFRVQTFQPNYTGFQFDFYLYNPSGGPDQIPKYVGNMFILPQNFKDSVGDLTLPITGPQGKPAGMFTVDYLIIKPLQGYCGNMKFSYAKYWKHRRPLDVGHRGMGSTFHGSHLQESECPKENTLLSFNEAGKNGADFVEFDVQLTKDRVPIIFHDFVVSLTLRKNLSDELDWFEVPVADLKMEHLQKLKIDHRSEQEKGGPSRAPLTSVEKEEQSMFPTLKDCLLKLDPHIGFNIEIKYCMHLKTGAREDGLRYFDERNQYIDIILVEVLEHAGNRRIIFSTFDPDVCTFIRMKQNRYPVMFLTQGITVKYDDFDDLRTRDTKIAFHFAMCEKFLGVVPHTEQLLKQPELITEGKDLGLILFCWGADNNSRENIKYFKDLGIDGVIYDRIHELKEAKENVFKVENEAKAQLMGICNGN